MDGCSIKTVTNDTNRRLVRLILILSLLAGCVPHAETETSSESQTQTPYRRTRDYPVDYTSSDPLLPEPNVTTVDIGYFGPNTPNHPLAGAMWCAAQMAVDQANTDGGYRGKPFRLLSRWSDNPWGTGVRDIVRLVYDDRVWAIVGGIDGPTTHLAEQIAVKARVPLLSPVSTDKTVNLVNIPWMFSYAPQDHLTAPVLAAAIHAHVGSDPYSLISTTEHDAHLFLVELQKSLHSSPALQLEIESDANDLDAVIAKTLQTQALAVILIAQAHDSARLVTGLRNADFQGTIFGGPWMGQFLFLQAAGSHAEGVHFPLLYEPGKFDQSFSKHCTNKADYLAAYTYDAISHLVKTIRQVGLNRIKIRAALADGPHFDGITGPIQWDNVGSNRKRVGLGTVFNGKIVRGDP